MPDYTIPTSDTAGSMSLQELLPGIDLSQYDLSEFEDIIPEFSTALLEMSQISGAQDISSAISGAQSQYMQVPTGAQVSGAGGFAGSGGGGAGFIGAQQAQRGMFTDVYSAMLGAERSEMKELERLKGEAGQFFSDILPDLEKRQAPVETYSDRVESNINLYGDNPGARESGMYGPQGSPGFSGDNIGTLQKGPDGQTYRWNGGMWEIVAGQYDDSDYGSYTPEDTGEGTGFIDPTMPRTGP